GGHFSPEHSGAATCAPSQEEQKGQSNAPAYEGNLSSRGSICMISSGLRKLLAGAAIAALGVVASSAAWAQAVTVVLDTEPDQLDPCQIAKSQVGPVNKQNIIETLTELDPEDGSIEPRLATSWE